MSKPKVEIKDDHFKEDIYIKFSKNIKLTSLKLEKQQYKIPKQKGRPAKFSIKLADRTLILLIKLYMLSCD